MTALYNIGSRPSNFVPFRCIQRFPFQFINRTLHKNKRKEDILKMSLSFAHISPPTSVAGVLIPILGGMLDDLLFLARGIGGSALVGGGAGGGSSGEFCGCKCGICGRLRLLFSLLLLLRGEDGRDCFWALYPGIVMADPLSGPRGGDGDGDGDAVRLSAASSRCRLVVGNIDTERWRGDTFTLGRLHTLTLFWAAAARMMGERLLPELS